MIANTEILRYIVYPAPNVLRVSNIILVIIIITLTCPDSEVQIPIVRILSEKIIRINC